jgi:crotonobetainyl-CoA:carnitine CoA-transferase CaiB-like acyl-CoA transferase
MGVLAGVLEARASGVGRVVDASIVDGVAHLMTGTHSFLAIGQWRDERGVNMLDGGAPFYRVYETADGRHMAVGAIEARGSMQSSCACSVSTCPSPPSTTGRPGRRRQRRSRDG